jgi:hypothetical protein
LEGTVGSDLSGSVTLDGLPSTYRINIDHLPKIQLGIDPVDLTVKLKPVDLNLAIKELPSIRGHLPADFSVGLSIFGLELMCVRLCGEAQIITEPYHPNPCEICEQVTKAIPPPNTPTRIAET